MVGHDAVATAAAATTAGGSRRRLGTPVIAGLGIATLIAIAVAVLVAVLGSGTATAQSDPGPQPYGGALERVDPGDQITGEEVLEVAMLSLGTLNGLAFAIAMVASRLRGPSTAQTRRALIARTGEGVVSESRRERRERARLRARRPVPSRPIAVVPHGPRTRTTQVPRPGAVPAQGRPANSAVVPAQGGPATREGLVPAARAPRPAGYRHPAPTSPPVGVPAPIRPASPR